MKKKKEMKSRSDQELERVQLSMEIQEAIGCLLIHPTVLIFYFCLAMLFLVGISP